MKKQDHFCARPSLCMRGDEY